jgi:hypothetical protein
MCKEHERVEDAPIGWGLGACPCGALGAAAAALARGDPSSNRAPGDLKVAHLLVLTLSFGQVDHLRISRSRRACAQWSRANAFAASTSPQLPDRPHRGTGQLRAAARMLWGATFSAPPIASAQPIARLALANASRLTRLKAQISRANRRTRDAMKCGTFWNAPDARILEPRHFACFDWHRGSR